MKLWRGRGRYDEVGAIFGRNRPAVGFSLDLKSLAEAAGVAPVLAAILAPWAKTQRCARPCGDCANWVKSSFWFCRVRRLQEQVFARDRELGPCLDGPAAPTGVGDRSTPSLKD